MPRAALWNPARRSATIYAARRATSSVGSTSHRDLPSVLETFRESYPEVKIVVQYPCSPEVCVAVAADEVDLGLVAYPQIRPGLKFEPFGEDEPVVIYHSDHDLADRRRPRIYCHPAR